MVLFLFFSAMGCSHPAGSSDQQLSRPQRMCPPAVSRFYHYQVLTSRCTTKRFSATRQLDLTSSRPLVNQIFQIYYCIHFGSNGWFHSLELGDNPFHISSPTRPLNNSSLKHQFFLFSLSIIMSIPLDHSPHYVISFMRSHITIIN